MPSAVGSADSTATSAHTQAPLACLRLPAVAPVGLPYGGGSLRTLLPTANQTEHRFPVVTALSPTTTLDPHSLILAFLLCPITHRSQTYCSALMILIPYIHIFCSSIWQFIWKIHKSCLYYSSIGKKSKAKQNTFKNFFSFHSLQNKVHTLAEKSWLLLV